MSGIVGSRFNIRGSGLVGSLGTDGQVFTSSGAGKSAVYEAVAGGITNAREWKLSSSVTGDPDPITGWSTCTDTMAGNIGSDMTHSSGVFSFPSTGIWLIQANFKWYAQSYSGDWRVHFQLSVDGGSNWTGGVCGEVYQREMSATNTNGVMIHPPFLLDIANTTNNKIRCGIVQTNDNIIIEGSSGEKTTFIQFIRLGDT